MIGASDYTEHNAQPWDGFVYLNPYASNILKYLLRNKRTTERLNKVVEIVDDVIADAPNEDFPFCSEFKMIKKEVTDFIDTVDTRLNDLKKALSYAEKINEYSFKLTENNSSEMYDDRTDEEERVCFANTIVTEYKLSAIESAIVFNLFLCRHIEPIISLLDELISQYEDEHDGEIFEE